MILDDDIRRLLSRIANLPEGASTTVHRVATQWGIAIADLRELVDAAVEEGFVERRGRGISAVIEMTWSGRKALEAALSGFGGVSIHGGIVQIGTSNRQYLGDDDADEDEFDDVDDEA